MSQKTFIINSADRLNEGNQSISDFHYNVQSFTDQLKDIYVESVQLYNSSYTVNNYNYQICWQIMTSGGSPMLISYYSALDLNIHAGYYDINSLLSVIETQMNLDAQNGETYSLTIDSLTNLVKIECDLFDMVLLNTEYTLWKRLGFTNKKLSTLRTNFYDPYNLINFDAWIIQSSYSTIHYGQSTPRLSTNYYKILISGISADTIDSNQQHQCVAIVPNNLTFGSMLDYQPPFVKKITLPSSFVFNRINIKVLDDENNLADLNTEFSFVLVAHSTDYNCGCK